MIRRLFPSFFLALAIPMAGHAATFQVFSDPPIGLEPSNLIGSFEAPLNGGIISGLVIEQSGVIFDLRVDLGAPIEYDAAVNEFRVPGGSSFSYTNTADFPGFCGPGDCGLELYPLPDDPTQPGDLLAIDALFNNIDEGTKYVIVAPPTVPLPPAGLALVAGIAGLMALRRKR